MLPGFGESPFDAEDMQKLQKLYREELISPLRKSFNAAASRLPDYRSDIASLDRGLDLLDKIMSAEPGKPPKLKLLDLAMLPSAMAAGRRLMEASKKDPRLEDEVSSALETMHNFQEKLKNDHPDLFRKMIEMAKKMSNGPFGNILGGANPEDLDDLMGGTDGGVRKPRPRRRPEPEDDNKPKDKKHDLSGKGGKIKF